MASSSVQQPVRFDETSGERVAHRRRALYSASTVVLSVIVLSVLAEGLFSLSLYGVDDAQRSAAAGGTELSVRYPRVSRGQLDSQLTVTVRRRSGFDDQVTIEIPASYLAAFTMRRVTPEAASESQRGDAVAFSFDPPSGDSLVVRWDLAARPIGWFTSVDGRATIPGEPPEGDLSIAFRSDLRP